MLLLAFGRFALTDFDVDFVRGVIRQQASVAAAVDKVFGAEVVLIEEDPADACNADKKAVWMAALRFDRPQCSRARISFQLGTQVRSFTLPFLVNSW